jgi:hypothetical protein
MPFGMFWEKGISPRRTSIVKVKDKLI